MREIIIPNNTVVSIEKSMEVKLHIPPYDISTNPILLSPAHKNTILVLATGEEDTKDVDALITENKDLELGIRKLRDCAPVCLCDGDRLGLVHVGWQGFSLSLVEKALEYFNTEKVHIYVGPFLHNFEIQKDACYDQIMAKKEGQVEKYIEESEKIIFHFKDALANVLPDTAIFDSRNTQYDEVLASYRFSRDKMGYLLSVRFI